MYILYLSKMLLPCELDSRKSSIFNLVWFVNSSVEKICCTLERPFPCVPSHSQRPDKGHSCDHHLIPSRIVYKRLKNVPRAHPLPSVELAPLRWAGFNRNRRECVGGPDIFQHMLFAFSYRIFNFHEVSVEKWTLVFFLFFCSFAGIGIPCFGIMK